MPTLKHRISKEARDALDKAQEERIQALLAPVEIPSGAELLGAVRPASRWSTLARGASGAAPAVPAPLPPRELAGTAPAGLEEAKERLGPGQRVTAFGSHAGAVEAVLDAQAGTYAVRLDNGSRVVVRRGDVAVT